MIKVLTGVNVWNCGHDFILLVLINFQTRASKRAWDALKHRKKHMQNITKFPMATCISVTYHGRYIIVSEQPRREIWTCIYLILTLSFLLAFLDWKERSITRDFSQEKFVWKQQPNGRKIGCKEKRHFKNDEGERIDRKERSCCGNERRWNEKGWREKHCRES